MALNEERFWWILASGQPETMQAWGTIGTYEAREETNPISQDSSPLNDACNAGGLLATVIHNEMDVGEYFPVYDGNGNVMGYVRGADGLLVAQYEYGPFGELLRATGPLSQTFNYLFSTKYHDWETGLYYYGHRYYNPTTGRWPSRDPICNLGFLLLGYHYHSIFHAVRITYTEYFEGEYRFINNEPMGNYDLYGLFGDGYHGKASPGQFRGHSDFFGHACFDYTAEDHDPATEPVRHAQYHFQDFATSLRQVRDAIYWCDIKRFGRTMHRLQDFYSHWDKGFRYDPPFKLGHFLVYPNPDHDNHAWLRAEMTTRAMVREWNARCYCLPCFP